MLGREDPMQQDRFRALGDWLVVVICFVCLVVLLWLPLHSIKIVQRNLAPMSTFVALLIWVGLFCLVYYLAREKKHRFGWTL